MNIPVLVTTSIIVILIILYSWNAIYENYTDLLNSNKNLFITDNDGNTSKYSVDSFVSSIDNDLQQINRDISSLTTRIEGLSSTPNFSNVDTRLKKIENIFSNIFPSGRNEFQLVNTALGMTRKIDLNKLKVLTQDKTFTLQNKGKLTYLTLSAIPSNNYISGNIRDQFIANGGSFQLSKNLT